MSITINRSIDVEDAIRTALDPYMTAYCPPLPESFTVPCILVQATGGDTDATASGKGKVDSFGVTIDSRANEESDALEALRTAVAIITETKDAGYAHAEVNSLYSWGVDPVRPDLAMCSAALVVTAHRETITIEGGNTNGDS